MAGRIYEILAADHRRLDNLLQKALAGSQLDYEAFENFRAGLLRHIGMEEKVLFPTAQKKVGKPIPGVDKLRQDHSQLAAMLVPTPSKAIAEDIKAVLAAHNQLEEGPQGVYARCEEAIGEDIPDTLDKLRRYPAVPLAPHFDGPGTYKPRPRRA